MANWNKIKNDKDFQQLSDEEKEIIRQKFIVNIQEDKDFQLLNDEQKNNVISKITFKPVENIVIEDNITEDDALGDFSFVVPEQRKNSEGGINKKKKIDKTIRQADINKLADEIERDRVNNLGSTISVDIAGLQDLTHKNFEKAEKERKQNQALEFIARRRKMVEEGGLKNAFIFGGESSGIGSLLRYGINKKLPQFVPDTVGEKIAFGGGNFFFDAPLFINPTVGFVTSRMFREIAKKREEDAEVSFQTILDVFAEGGKGFIERLTLGALSRGTGTLINKISPAELRGRIFRNVARAGSIIPEAVALTAVSSKLDTGKVDIHLEDLFANTALSLMLKTPQFIKGTKQTIVKEGLARKLAKDNNLSLREARNIMSDPEKAVPYQREYQAKALEDIKTRDNINAILNAPDEVYLSKEKGFGLQKFEEHISDAQKVIRGKLDNINNELAKLSVKTLSEGEFLDIAQQKNIKTFTDLARETIRLKSFIPAETRAVEMAKALQKYFVSSWGVAVRDSTPTGKKIFDMFTNYLREGELKGGALTKRYEDILKPITKKRRSSYIKLDTNASELLFKYLNKDKIKWDELESDFKKRGFSDKKIGEVRKLVEPTRQILNELVKEAQQVGVKQLNQDGTETLIEEIPNYAPRELNKEAITKDPLGFLNNLLEKGYIKGDNLPEVIFNVISEGRKLTPQQLKKFKVKKVALVNADMLDSKILQERKASYQHERRFHDISEKYYMTDATSILNYIQEMSMIIERTKAFGANNEKIESMLVDVAGEAANLYGAKRAEREFTRAKSLVEAMTGVHRGVDPHLDQFTNFVLNTQILSKMTTSSMGQIPQLFAAAYRGNMRAFGRAFLNKNFGVLKGKVNRQKALDFTREAGINLGIVRKDLYNILTGGSGLTGLAAEKMLRWTGFEKLDAFNRTVAGLSGMFYGDWLAQRISKKMTRLIKKHGGIDAIPEGVYNKEFKFETRRLAGMDLNIGELFADGKIKDGGRWEVTLSDRQKRLAARKFEIDTNFRTRAIDLPEFGHSTPGRFVRQFKSFAFNQTKNLRDNVVREVKAGNPMPLVWLAIAGGVPGAVTREIRNLLTRPDNIYNTLVQGDGYEMLKTSPALKAYKNDDEMIDFIVGAIETAGAVGIIETIYNTIKFESNPFGPAAGEITNGIRAMHDAYKTESTKPLSGFLLKQFPLGYRWGRIFKESTKKTKITSTKLRRARLRRTRRRSLR